MKPTTARSLLAGRRVLPLGTFASVDAALSAAEALSAGGVDILEVALRTPASQDALAAIVKRLPRMICGAGTVLDSTQANAALDAGAAFLVSPGFSPSVAEAAARAGVPYLPGCVTPTEIMAARERGFDLLKFFPASVYGGPAALKALAAPFPDLAFLPTGGVTFDNLAAYLALPQVISVGGSFLLEGDIRAHCRRLQEILR